MISTTFDPRLHCTHPVSGDSTAAPGCLPCPAAAGERGAEPHLNRPGVSEWGAEPRPSPRPRNRAAVVPVACAL